MILKGYRINLTGVFGYDFIHEGETICQIHGPVIPSPPVYISSNGQHFVSEFDADSTIYPGLTRYVIPEDSTAEQIRIVYRQQGHYEITNGAFAVYADTSTEEYRFSLQHEVIAVIRKYNGSPETLDDMHEYFFDVEMKEGIDSLIQMMILAFPMLQFAL